TGRPWPCPRGAGRAARGDRCRPGRRQQRAAAAWRSCRFLRRAAIVITVDLGEAETAVEAHRCLIVSLDLEPCRAGAPQMRPFERRLDDRASVAAMSPARADNDLEQAGEIAV